MEQSQQRLNQAGSSIVHELLQTIQKLINEAKSEYTKIKDVKNTQFTKEEMCIYEEKTTFLIKEYITFTFHWKKNQTSPFDGEELQIRKSEFQLILSWLLAEIRKMLLIEKRQKITQKIQKLKKRFYAIADSDTSKEFLNNLSQDVKRLKKKCDRDKLEDKFPDLMEEIIFLLEKTEKANKNTNKQIAVEAVSGVLTLGCAAAGGVIGAVGLAAKAGPAATAAVETSTKGVSALSTGIKVGKGVITTGTAIKQVTDVVKSVCDAVKDDSSVTKQNNCVSQKGIEEILNNLNFDGCLASNDSQQMYVDYQEVIMNYADEMAKDIFKKLLNKD